MSSTAAVSQNETSIDAQSLTLLNAQASSSCTYFVVGIPGAVGNVLLIATIIKNKTLRSKFYLCLMHLAIADALFSAFVVALGIIRFSHYVTQTPQTSTPDACAPLLCFMGIMQLVGPAQTVCIALDRTVAVAMPMKYKLVKTKHVSITNALAWIVPTAVMIGITPASVSTAQLIPVCTTGATFSPSWQQVAQTMGTTFDIVTASLYVVLLMLLVKRFLAARNQGQNLEQIKTTLQFKAAVTAFMLFGVYTCVALLGQLFLLVTSVLPASTKSVVQPHALSIFAIGIDLALLITICRGSDIRSAMRALVWKKKAAVVAPLPVATTKM